MCETYSNREILGIYRSIHQNSVKLGGGDEQQNR